MLDKFEIFANRAGLSVGLILAIGALIVAGPFPLVPQELRLGGSIGAAAIILLLTRPLAGQFGKISRTGASKSKKPFTLTKAMLKKKKK
jgi:hypothetical protein